VTPVITRLEGKHPAFWRLTGIHTAQDVDVDGMICIVEQFRDEHAFLLSKIAPCQFSLLWHQKTFHAVGMPPVACAQWMEMDFEGDMLQLVDLLMMKPSYGTLMRHEPPDFSTVPEHQVNLEQDYDDLREWARQVTKEEFKKQTALAAAAVLDKQAEPTEEQRKMYLFRAALKDEFNTAQLKKLCVVDVTESTRFMPWARGLSQYAKSMVGYHYDNVLQKMMPVRLLDLCSSTGSQQKLMSRKALILHGQMKTGKTPVAHCIMRWLTQVEKKQFYWFSTDYDSLGKYCADNGNAHFAGYVFDDCAPVTLQNTKLSVDDWRGVFELEGGSFKSRYQPAQLGKGQYRILTMNNKQDVRTRHPVSFFTFYGLHACDAVLRGDEAAFRRASTMNDADGSIASRVIIFNVQGMLLSEAHLQHLDASNSADVRQKFQEHPEEHTSDEDCIVSESYSESET
jgi:hypothetical protein